jgi:hypothetical protein
MAITSTESTDDPVKLAVLGNPWRNAYWFSRMLISSEKYAGIGTKNTGFIQKLAAGMQLSVDDDTQVDSVKVSLAISYFRSLVEERFIRKGKTYDGARLLFEDVSKKLLTVDDVKVFICAAESIVVPINQAMTSIPNNDREFTVSFAKSYLDTLGTKGLGTVVGFWDDAGVEGCLNAERLAVVKSFAHLRRDLTHLPEIEGSLVLTAFMQEFERRLGQKRKNRAGGSLEDVASFLFSYYGIKAEEQPEHFQADIEVDKWVRCKDKWLIAISCKRTLRERWKQVSSSPGVLSNHRIKEIWHLITYDDDLSDDKLALLGGQRHIFYLRDESPRLAIFSKHKGLKDYVRPMSSFIDQLKKEIG